MWIVSIIFVKFPTPNRYVAFEPLLGPVKGANLKGLGWVMVAGESGKNARAMEGLLDQGHQG